VRVRRWAVYLLTTALLATLLVEKVPITYRTVGASPLNPGPEGTSTLVEVLRSLGYEVTVVESWSTARLSGVPCLILVTSPELPYGSSDVEALASLVELGSNLVVADEGVYSNELLRRLGVPVRISGNQVRAGGSYVFKVAVSLGNRSFDLVYAYASGLVVEGSAEVLSEVGGVPLAVSYRRGNSTVVVLGDGTPLTNALLNPRNVLNPNYAFVTSLVGSLCRGGVVAVEASRYRTEPQPAVAWGGVAGAYLAAAVRVASLALVVVVALSLRATSPTRSPPTLRSTGELPGSYEVARALCRDVELAEVLRRSCARFSRGGKPEEVLRDAVGRIRESRELGRAVLRALLRRS
jgi:hypothetical protein